MVRIPDAVRAGCWLNGWLAQRVSADAVIAGVAPPGVPVAFVLPGEPPLSAALLLGQLRTLGVKAVGVALPVAGDPQGLGGPPPFNAAALDAGAALLLHGPGLGLLPQREGGVLTWVAAVAETPSYVPDVAEADRGLRQALTRAVDELAGLDVAAWNPDVADAFMNLRRATPSQDQLTFASPEATRTAMTGLRCHEIVRLARRDDGGALSAPDAERRRSALAPLDRAARAAVAAACSSVDGR